MMKIGILTTLLIAVVYARIGMEIETGNYLALDNHDGSYGIIPKYVPHTHNMWNLYVVQESQTFAQIEFQVDHNTNPGDARDKTSKIEFVTTPCTSKPALIALVTSAAGFAKAVSEAVESDVRIKNYCSYWAPKYEGFSRGFSNHRTGPTGAFCPDGMPNGQDPGVTSVSGIGVANFAPASGYTIPSTAANIADVVTGITPLDCLSGALRTKKFVVVAEPQTTMGIKLGKIPYLMKSVGSTHFSKSSLAKHVAAASTALEKILLTIPSLGSTSDEEQAEFLGFLSLLNMIIDAPHGEVAAQLNAKTLSGTMLSRGSFVYIFSLLSDTIKDTLRTKFKLKDSDESLPTFAAWITEEFGANSDRSLFPNGMPIGGVGGTVWKDVGTDPKGVHPDSIRLGNWIVNFAKALNPVDALKAGYTDPQSHANTKIHDSFSNQLDDFGVADTVDGKKVLPVELRKMYQVAYVQWMDLAANVYDYMDAINAATDYLDSTALGAFTGKFSEYVGSVSGTARDDVEAPAQNDANLPALGFRQLKRNPVREMRTRTTRQ